MQTRDAMQAARLAMLEGAILALLRDAQDEGFDGLTIDATADSGLVAIDLSYSSKGMPMAGGAL